MSTRFEVQTFDKSSGTEHWSEIEAPSAEQAKRIAAAAGMVVGAVRLKAIASPAAPPQADRHPAADRMMSCRVCKSPLIERRSMPNPSARSTGWILLGLGLVVMVLGLALAFILVGCFIAPVGLIMAIVGLFKLGARSDQLVCQSCGTVQ